MRITEMFQESFPEITRPLKKGNEEERFETIYTKKMSPPLQSLFSLFMKCRKYFRSDHFADFM